jgi:hypothetical protein
MKATLILILLLTSALATLGQGTVQFSNTSLSKLSTVEILGTPAVVPTTPGLIQYGLFYGIGQSTSLTLLTSQFGVNNTVTDGLIANPVDGSSPMNVVPIPGTSGGDTDVWVQVLAWSASFGTDYVSAHQAFLAEAGPVFWGQSHVVNLNGLGPTTGPGIAMWTSSTGTNPHVIQAFTISFVPEPGVFALAGLAMVSLACRRKC